MCWNLNSTIVCGMLVHCLAMYLNKQHGSSYRSIYDINKQKRETETTEKRNQGMLSIWHIKSNRAKSKRNDVLH